MCETKIEEGTLWDNYKIENLISMSKTKMGREYYGDNSKMENLISMSKIKMGREHCGDKMEKVKSKSEMIGGSARVKCAVVECNAGY